MSSPPTMADNIVQEIIEICRYAIDNNLISVDRQTFDNKVSTITNDAELEDYLQTAWDSIPSNTIRAQLGAY